MYVSQLNKQADEIITHQKFFARRHTIEIVVTTSRLDDKADMCSVQQLTSNRRCRVSMSYGPCH